MMVFQMYLLLKRYSHVWYLCWISGGCLPGNTLQPPNISGRSELSKRQDLERHGRTLAQGFSSSVY